MIFVPFIGIDNHRRCVTFMAGLIANESTESYIWLLKTFLKAFGSQPSMIVTDQDAAMKNAINIVLSQSRHRLCMWYINKKLSDKVPSKVFNHPEFKKTFHKTVWDSKIHPEESEASWSSLIQNFDLQSNSWLSVMFDMRNFQLSSLMQTTSRSECDQCLLDHQSLTTNSIYKTFLPIERFTTDVYTRSNFFIVQK
uniref:MULE transposase domain-containing protein n=1 Tax=Lactuca sativa TaxID=4236 RepID=A0A9R1V6W7_LACSA|nr:hypothetical protein LSAT_V11C600313860 [Lactuca sativa]